MYWELLRIPVGDERTNRIYKYLKFVNSIIRSILELAVFLISYAKTCSRPKFMTERTLISIISPEAKLANRF